MEFRAFDHRRSRRVWRAEEGNVSVHVSSLDSDSPVDRWMQCRLLRSIYFSPALRSSRTRAARLEATECVPFPLFTFPMHRARLMIFR